jgi:hypothetical protein
MCFIYYSTKSLPAYDALYNMEMLGVVSERIHIALRVYTTVNYDVRLILRKEGADEFV